MSEPTPRPEGLHQSPAAKARLARRYAAERRFRAYGLAAIGAALFALALLLVTVVARGSGAFREYVVHLDVEFDPARLGVAEAVADRAPDDLRRADYDALEKDALAAAFPEVSGRSQRRELRKLLSAGAPYELQRLLLAKESLLGTRQRVALPLDDEAQLYFKGAIESGTPEEFRKLSDAQIGWLEEFAARGQIESRFSMRFMVSGDSREPELAGIRGATVGSALTLILTLLLCFPVGVAAAVYLEEFAERSRFTDFVEVNINNLAAVPSIVFGLLGLAVFLNFFGLPRSAPMVGGLVLALMTLPTVIISARSALAAVPPSIREAALGVGASPLQVVLHHVLPLALPGILTGTIIGMARALGETAPLLMIGMVAFIADVPEGLRSPSTVLPVQIFLWADAPERAFVEKTSGAILVLLLFLVAMNLSAVLLRNRFDRRW